MNMTPFNIPNVEEMEKLNKIISLNDSTKPATQEYLFS